jgi:hypothetical protein
MGDTLPKNFKYFDLRQRYSKSSFNYAAFLQDLGRAFGWEDDHSKRPIVFLNETSYEVAQNPVQCILDKKLRVLDPCLKKPSVLVPKTNILLEDDDLSTEEECDTNVGAEV